MCNIVPSYYSVTEDGTYQFNRHITFEEIVNLATGLIQFRFQRSDEAYTSPSLVRRFLTMQLQAYEQEVFACMFLDHRHRLIKFEKLFYGTIDGAAVYPREVVKRALAYNAAAIICTHNHPSGVAEPSMADREITDRLEEALKVVDVRILDHIVVSTGGATVSFAERGWI